MNKLSTLILLVVAIPALPASESPDPAPVDPTPMPIPMTGSCPPALAPFDRLMTSFMREHRVPGGALAVVKDGRLAAARGYGWADREAKRPVEPSSLFRIASISKPITAVAILQLAERGKLRLEDRAFTLLGFQPHLEKDAEVDPRLEKVTIVQLLRHTAGFDRSASFDPMFRSRSIARALNVPPPAGPKEIIRYMLGRPLDFDPGARYAYSNFGYCVLGRVIEKVTGKAYEEYVRKEVLAPLGIRDMRIGRTLPGGRAPNEVAYYHYREGTGPAVIGEIGEPAPLPYGAWYLEAMDAHGGWIGSAVDLARFATAFDDPERCKLLGAESIRTMFSRPPGEVGFEASGKPKAAYYACGWLVRPVGNEGRANHWHTGSLDGTAALLVRRHDGLNWAVLFNTRRSHKTPHLTKAIDPLLHGAANAVRKWPGGDLFGTSWGERAEASAR